MCEYETKNKNKHGIWLEANCPRAVQQAPVIEHTFVFTYWTKPGDVGWQQEPLSLKTLIPLGAVDGFYRQKLPVARRSSDLI